MSNEPDKIIYSMIRVSKRHGQREVLKDISLSYFYGAKIGVLGLNGSGKSSLLKILAGVDQSFEGKTVLAPGYTIGYLEQEPLVNEMRTVREVVEEGAQELVNLVKEFEEINAKFAEPMEPEEMDKLIERQGQVQELMDAKGAWDLDSKLEMAMDALRCPPGDTPVSVISGGEKRRVALCRLLLQNPDILLLDRTYQPLGRRIRGVVGTVPPEFPRYGHCRDPRPLLPRQRRGMDSRAGSWPRDSVEGQLFLLAGAERKAPRSGRQGRGRAPQDPQP